MLLNIPHKFIQIKLHKCILNNLFMVSPNRTCNQVTLITDLNMVNLNTVNLNSVNLSTVNLSTVNLRCNQQLTVLLSIKCNGAIQFHIQAQFQYSVTNVSKQSMYLTGSITVSHVEQIFVRIVDNSLHVEIYQ